MSDAIMKKARETAGYRERYAMDNYTVIQKRKENGHKLLTFMYSPDDPYQDGNGATYDIKRNVWVG